jgi:hypothetical protein
MKTLWLSMIGLNSREPVVVESALGLKDPRANSRPRMNFQSQDTEPGSTGVSIKSENQETKSAQIHFHHQQPVRHAVQCQKDKNTAAA